MTLAPTMEKAALDLFLKQGFGVDMNPWSDAAAAQLVAAPAAAAAVVEEAAATPPAAEKSWDEMMAEASARAIDRYLSIIYLRGPQGTLRYHYPLWLRAPPVVVIISLPPML